MTLAEAALYARVSTARQEREQTIASQIAALHLLAKEKGLVVPDELVFTDEGYSGSRLDRPGLDRLRDLAAEGRVTTLLVHDPDRFARNYVHQQVLLEELQRRNVAVVFAERPLTDRPEDRLLVQMQGVIAEYERTKILERTRRGRLYKVRTGAWTGWTTAPYGYRWYRPPGAAAGTVLVEEGEALWARQMFVWVTEEGLSARQVARRLNARGVPPRRARVWVAGSVYRILTNPVYGGTAYYNRTEAAEPKHPPRPGVYRRNARSAHRPRPREEWIETSVPALTTPEIQARVRTQLARNRRTSPRNTRYPYLLRSLAVCGACGWKMSVFVGHAKVGPHPRGGREWYAYYQCRTSTLGPEDTGRLERCKARRVRADRLDEVVWSSLVEWLQRPELVRAEMMAWAAEAQSRLSSEEGEGRRWEERKRQLERQGHRLLDGYQAGLIDLEELRRREERVRAEQDQVEARLAAIQRLQEHRVQGEELFRGVESFCERVRAGIDGLSFEERVRLVRLLVERVIVTGDEVTVEHIVPLTGRFSDLRQGCRTPIQRSEGIVPPGPSGDGEPVCRGVANLDLVAGLVGQPPRSQRPPRAQAARGAVSVSAAPVVAGVP